MTKEQFEDWVASLAPNEQEQAKSFFTVIRWRENSNAPSDHLIAIPYSTQYVDDLTRAAGLLREAASLTDNASLKKFLNLRADAFLSNDYYESDMAWMDLDAPLDITIGPYETYNDELFGYKAAFEAYVNLARRRGNRQAVRFLRSTCRRSKITCRSTRNTAIPNWARRRRFEWWTRF